MEGYGREGNGREGEGKEYEMEGEEKGEGKEMVGEKKGGGRGREWQGRRRGGELPEWFRVRLHHIVAWTNRPYETDWGGGGDQRGRGDDEEGGEGAITRVY